MPYLLPLLGVDMGSVCKNNTGLFWVAWRRCSPCLLSIRENSIRARGA